jgi:hypothetical protein
LRLAFDTKVISISARSGANRKPPTAGSTTIELLVRSDFGHRHDGRPEKEDRAVAEARAARLERSG